MPVIVFVLLTSKNVLFKEASSNPHLWCILFFLVCLLWFPNIPVTKYAIEKREIDNRDSLWSPIEMTNSLYPAELTARCLLLLGTRLQLVLCVLLSFVFTGRQTLCSSFPNAYSIPTFLPVTVLLLQHPHDFLNSMWSSWFASYRRTNYLRHFWLSISHFTFTLLLLLVPSLPGLIKNPLSPTRKNFLPEKKSTIS